jgi:hypothetical protein
MKLLPVVLSLSVLAPLAAVAQSPTPSTKPGAAPSAAPKPAKSAKPALARSAAKAVEEMTPIDEDSSVTLSEADLAMAQRVYVGRMPCELGASVQVTPAKRAGFFLVQVSGGSGGRFYMHPVESRTGAIRLEDPKRGALWLQLGNKSMLMSQKLGRRVADECMSPEQVVFADELKKNPPKSLLEPLDPPTAAPEVRVGAQ